MKKTTYEVLLFDADDTLLDYGLAEKRALTNTFEAFGHPTGLKVCESSFKEMSSRLWKKLEQGLISLAELGESRFHRLFEMHHLEIDAKAFSHAYFDNLSKEAHLKEGALALCDSLKEFRLAIITNGFANMQTSRIGSSPLHNAFEQIIISENAGSQKPQKEIFEYAFAQLQVTDKKKVLIIGDSLTSDIQGGIDFGIDTCWYNPEGKENHIGNQPTYEIRHLMDLVKILKAETCA
ncbi:YjjG family noncanonical pyrimidine nucleotidase [Sporosarcina sp. HYO08]|uniref:YjjG family noncanonical pyrimidine nucleotidase n=1 Tax=Sporosarcina sp. HYO08 TaxID=1759557 RepID=UPI00079CB29E|nr:YjjG family noncanonical pyrimidine nucleotidase [Sporosarcina sp. HYO08]KXH81814.1 2-haloalkanoic acid dehalogenase [Sporosarcina sp. HYO08]